MTPKDRVPWIWFTRMVITLGKATTYTLDIDFKEPDAINGLTLSKMKTVPSRVLDGKISDQG